MRIFKFSLKTIRKFGSNLQLVMLSATHLSHLLCQSASALSVCCGPGAILGI